MFNNISINRNIFNFNLPVKFNMLQTNSIDFQKIRMSQAISEKEEMAKNLNMKIEEFNNEKSILINKINNILSRKLTLKERLLGKIIEKNEDK